MALIVLVCRYDVIAIQVVGEKKWTTCVPTPRSSDFADADDATRSQVYEMETENIKNRESCLRCAFVLVCVILCAVV